MKKLSLLLLLTTSSTLACSEDYLRTELQNIQNLKENIISEYKNKTYPKKRSEINSFKNTIKAFTSRAKTYNQCAYDLGGSPFLCTLKFSMNKEKVDGLTVTYPDAVNINMSCNFSQFLEFELYRNSKGKQILYKMGNSYIIKSVEGCKGSYPDELYSNRSLLFTRKSNHGKANFFVMDQYQDAPSSLKVLAKKYESNKDLEVKVLSEGIHFKLGDKAYALVDKTSGKIIESNFLKEDTYDLNHCWTYYDQGDHSVYPDTSVDHKRYNLNFKWVSQ